MLLVEFFKYNGGLVILVGDKQKPVCTRFGCAFLTRARAGEQPMSELEGELLVRCLFARAQSSHGASSHTPAWGESSLLKSFPLFTMQISPSTSDA